MFSCLSRNSDYRHIAIDPYQRRNYGYAGLETVKLSGYNQIQLIEERSDISLPALIRDYEGQMDLAFINGLHTSDATLSDMMTSLHLLRVGGVLVIDDCRIPPIAKAVTFKIIPAFERLEVVQITPVI